MADSQPLAQQQQCNSYPPPFQQQAQPHKTRPPVRVNLGQLHFSDGTGAISNHPRATRLPDNDMLKLLNNIYNHRDNHYTVIWDTPVHFVGSLPRGYSYWSYTTPGGYAVKEIYGHPSGKIFRSAPQFIPHVGEILRANEDDVRVILQTTQPYNELNNAAITNMASWRANIDPTVDNTVYCDCTFGDR